MFNDNLLLSRRKLTQLFCCRNPMQSRLKSRLNSSRSLDNPPKLVSISEIFSFCRWSLLRRFPVIFTLISTSTYCRIFVCKVNLWYLFQRGNLQLSNAREKASKARHLALLSGRWVVFRPVAKFSLQYWNIVKQKVKENKENHHIVESRSFEPPLKLVWENRRVREMRIKKSVWLRKVHDFLFKLSEVLKNWVSRNLYFTVLNSQNVHKKGMHDCYKSFNFFKLVGCKSGR